MYFQLIKNYFVIDFYQSFERLNLHGLLDNQLIQ